MEAFKQKHAGDIANAFVHKKHRGGREPMHDVHMIELVAEKVAKKAAKAAMSKRKRGRPKKKPDTSDEESAPESDSASDEEVDAGDAPEVEPQRRGRLPVAAQDATRRRGRPESSSEEEQKSTNLPIVYT